MGYKFTLFLDLLYCGLFTILQMMYAIADLRGMENSQVEILVATYMPFFPAMLKDFQSNLKTLKSLAWIGVQTPNIL